MTISPQLSSDCGLLVLSPISSSLTVSAPNDIEIFSTYQISLLITDNGPLGRSSTADVMITIIEGSIYIYIIIIIYLPSINRWITRVNYFD